MDKSNDLVMCRVCGEYNLIDAPCSGCTEKMKRKPKVSRHDNCDLPSSPVVYDHDGTQNVYYGLTKREWFAGMALQGILANHKLTDNFGIAYPIRWETNIAISEYAVEYADALLAALADTADTAEEANTADTAEGVEHE